MESTANEKILAGEPMYTWVFLITAALGILWYFLNTAIDFAEQHNQTEIASGLKSRWLKLYKKPYKSQVK
jgi:hypothetical protein